MSINEIEISDYPNGVLRLVKPVAAHAALSLQWLRDPEVGRYMGADFSGVSMSTEEKRIHELLTSNDTITWMIELDGQVIGNVEINSIKETSEEYSVRAGKFSTLIGEKDHWGKRIAPYAKRAIMSWAFSEGGFGLFVSKVLPENERSWKSLERLQFDYQGEKTETEDGITRQWRVYRMTKDHWNHVKQKVLV